MLVEDLIEVFNNYILEVYKFPTHLLSDFSKDNQLGLILADGVILPLTAVIFCHYVIISKRRWIPVLIFVMMEVISEALYVQFRYLIYLKWSLWISALLYTIGFIIYAKFTPHFLNKGKSVPYSLNIAALVYNVTGWFGAILGGEFLRFYQWRPHIFVSPHADDRFCAVGFVTILSIIAAVIVKTIKLRYRPAVFSILCIFIILFDAYANSKGWLIYYHWNLGFSVIRWCIPFSAIIWVDKKEYFQT